LRTLSASQVEKSTVSTAEFGSTHIRSGFGMKEIAEGEKADALLQENERESIEKPSEEFLANVRAGEAVGVCESCEG
jgi:hypothetical protein